MGNSLVYPEKEEEMNEITIMIRNILDMACEHIRKGFITKDFAGDAVEAFVNGLKLKCETDSEIQLNQMLDYWAKWSKIYIQNVNLGEKSDEPK